MNAPSPDQLKPSNLNIPNILTSLRIIVVPLFVWLVLTSESTRPGWMWASFVVFAALMITDKLDGDIARSRNLITDFGKIADPIADKTLMAGAFISLNITGALPIWVTVIILVREVGITVWRMVELRKGRIVPASKGGKFKTVLQTVAVALYLIPLPDYMSFIVSLFMYITVAVTALTGVQYLIDAAAVKKARG
ncbi:MULTISPECIES: CDP-diacylglycerol--glycerol-3-phosphate 3-phosphatidyltransferase [unclassified Corynebacterium]|uniref:CDP-diacylglycerol--glycerol-3-phosphate 3-phosphatidyltransferase n=1 Tax=unclassified Corynebacterium TaxID=2624378 RepID=UPI0021676E53|nr:MULTISPECIES: CDP-diacylglycerol--glycerol-3-phosphate 3-phosphatidyltransferase [unclassified Corynebacterium]MCS4490960.1 CDP-diacylglycerol--glycerol-3-phosphate 3-phosphatidyltransferase [Corynebacterium sp. ES2715-CONJ3]MCS4531158.1 CDP-diacylglycerol--glycerol-3-phosphate 3-phosphatidyltransferase [Corynebacterium sp. ES2730-CONJ]